MVDIINSSDISAKTITFKFLEAGHTFMSADSIHAKVEKRLRAAKNVYDFPDLVKCVQASKINVLEPSHTQFKNLKGQQSQPKLAKRPCMLSEIRVAQFRRGKSLMYVKKRHSDEEFISFDFLKKSIHLAQIITNH